MIVTKEMYDKELQAQYGQFRFIVSMNSGKWESVEYCARQLNLSPNYLSDLLKRETGKTTLEHIHFFLIEKAKNSLLNSSDTISGIAYSLGFEYPQHFSNLFKSKTGISPKEYRHLN